MTMNDGYVYRVSPHNAKVIERQPVTGATYWYFWKIADSPADAKRTLKVLKVLNSVEQGQLWEGEEEL